ncbi:MAG: hypothetical protein Q8N81_03315, partial [bacterium]|nr:hypothetical protein [bacterium]
RPKLCQKKTSWPSLTGNVEVFLFILREGMLLFPAFIAGISELIYHLLKEKSNYCRQKTRVSNFVASCAGRSPVQVVAEEGVEPS